VSGGHDNVVVPEGADCVLSHAVVAGNVEVKPFGSLTIGRDTYVRGNVQSDGGKFVRVTGPGVVIGGDVQIKKASEWSGYDPGLRIRGNFQYEENMGPLRAYGGVIRGDFQVFKNTGGAVISGNSISNNLQCKENFPPPAGGGNRVGGEKQDQCSGL
jgi:hypothetical protein